MCPEAVEYVLDNFETVMLKTLDDLGGELDRMRRRKDELEGEINNLTHAVAQGDFSPALRAALADREREISEITTKLLESRPDSLRVKLNNLRSFVALHMRDIRAIVNSDAAKARAIIRQVYREHYAHSDWRSLLGLWNLEFRWAWQHGWCRGTGSHHAFHGV